MRFLFVVHKNEEKTEQNSVLFHRLTIKERGLRPNGYFPLMRQPRCFSIMLYFKEINIEVRYQCKILTVDLFMRWCVIYL